MIYNLKNNVLLLQSREEYRQIRREIDSISGDLIHEKWLADGKYKQLQTPKKAKAIERREA